MADVLGLGVTHYPPLAGRDDQMANLLRATLADEGLPPSLLDPDQWPAPLRDEYGADGGTASAAAHRAALLEGFAEVRLALDEFEPDVVVIWGDDQYELFREPCIPSFAILAFDDMTVRPWAGGFDNVWDEPPETEVVVRGARPAAKALTAGLVDAGFDMAYSYVLPPGEPYPHAFLNTVLFLDYKRSGFPYPVLPISVNCYGSHVISRQGGIGPLTDIGHDVDLDPPSPTPSRCMALGAAVARHFADSPLRVALVASSSWSHAFLTDKTWRLHPDVDADRQLYEALRAGDYDLWRAVSRDSIEESGQQEMLNWFCLMGAMEALGRPRPSYSKFIETFAFNSNKTFCVF